MRSSFVFAAAFVAISLASSAALAQQPAPAPVATEPVKSLAETLTGFAKEEYLAAHRLYADGDYAKALLKFESAFAASNDARLFWNYGACHKALRRYADAIRDLERYKVEASAQIADKERADADALIGALRTYVAAVSIHVNEPGAAVLIDDAAVGEAPVERRLVDIGQHTIKVTKSGFVDGAASLDVTGPSDVVKDVTLARAPHEGRISIRAGAADTIAIDGRSVGMGQYEGTLGSGDHLIVVTAPGKKRFQGRVVVEDGQLRTMDVTLEPDRLIPLWAWITAGAVVAAGLTIGGVLLFKSDSTSSPPVVNGSMPPGIVQLPSWRL